MRVDSLNSIFIVHFSTTTSMHIIKYDSVNWNTWNSGETSTLGDTASRFGSIHITSSNLQCFIQKMLANRVAISSCYHGIYLYSIVVKAHCWHEG